METRIVKALLTLASPRVGNEVRKLVRELARVAGVRRVAPSTKLPRLLSVSYDPRVIPAETLVHYVRRDWAGARLV
jgi:hypothetical protein